MLIVLERTRILRGFILDFILIVCARRVSLKDGVLIGFAFPEDSSWG